MTFLSAHVRTVRCLLLGGITKIIGDTNRGTDNICIGIGAWESIANRHLLEVKNDASDRKPDGCFRYHVGSYMDLSANEQYLDVNRSHLLLVDDGTPCPDVETRFREKLETCIMEECSGGKMIPTVLCLVGGDVNSLKLIHNAVANKKSVCVLVKGTSGAADLLVHALNMADHIESKKHLPRPSQEDSTIFHCKRMFGHIF